MFGQCTGRAHDVATQRISAVNLDRWQAIQEHRFGEYWLDQLRRFSRATWQTWQSLAALQHCRLLCVFSRGLWCLSGRWNNTWSQVHDLILQCARPTEDPFFTRVQPLVHLRCLQPAKCFSTSCGMLHSWLRFVMLWCVRVWSRFWSCFSWGFDWCPWAFSDGLHFGRKLGSGSMTDMFDLQEYCSGARHWARLTADALRSGLFSSSKLSEKCGDSKLQQDARRATFHSFVFSCIISASWKLDGLTPTVPRVGSFLFQRKPNWWHWFHVFFWIDRIDISCYVTCCVCVA